MVEPDRAAAAIGLVGQVPADTVDRLRADVLAAGPDLVTEIHRQVPVYRRERTLGRGVALALRRYAELLDRPATGGSPPARKPGRPDPWRQWCLAAGANEARQGRTLDELQAAARVCARVAHRRLRRFAQRHSLPVEVETWLSERVFDQVDAVCAAAADGYRQAQRDRAGQREHSRRQLRELLLGAAPPSAQALAAVAEEAGWRVPRRLAVVAIAAPADRLAPLPPDILDGSDRTPPCLVVPDPESPAQIRTLTCVLGGRSAAVGLPVPPVAAAQSLRWARLALELSAGGVIPAAPLVWCRDHLASLALFQDRTLVAALTERRLAPLAHLRGARRELLAETLLAWLTANMNANEVAHRLHLHPQTVRQRLRQLEPLFGDRIRDPDQRFELEVALRAERAGRRRSG